MRVVINGRYTYETDLPVTLGSIVSLPSIIGGVWEGCVTALESEYTGDCRSVIAIVSNPIPRSVVLTELIKKYESFVADPAAFMGTTVDPRFVANIKTKLEAAKDELALLK